MRDPTRVPWYVTLWRILWYVPYIVGVAVAAIAMFFAMGSATHAKSFWKQNV